MKQAQAGMVPDDATRGASPHQSRWGSPCERKVMQKICGGAIAATACLQPGDEPDLGKPRGVATPDSVQS